MVYKRRLTDLLYILLAFLIIIFLFSHAPNLEYDAPTYIGFYPTRPLLYPTFIWLLHWAGSYQFILVMWVQGILLFSALLYTRYWLRKNLQIADFLIFLVCLLVTLTISFHFQIWYIGSEGLAFPLFIFTFFLAIECFQKFDIKKILCLAVLVSILVLTRLQFYYFYGIFVLLCIWYLWQRIPIRLLTIGIIILFGSILLTTLIDRSYHYFKHGYFGGAPYSGLMIMVQAIYLADNNAASYFGNTTEKAYVQKILDQRNAKHLNQDAVLVVTLKPSQLAYAYQFYSRNYIAILEIINNTLGTTNEKTLGNAMNPKGNAIATNIDKTLILHEPKKNMAFLFWKFVECMGGIPLFLFYSILLLALPIKIIKDKIRTPDLAPIFVTVISVLTFLNAAIIAACNPDLPAYFCYSQFMFYCLAAFLVNSTFIKNTVYNKPLEL